MSDKDKKLKRIAIILGVVLLSSRSEVRLFQASNFVNLCIVTVYKLAKLRKKNNLLGKLNTGTQIGT